MSVKSLFGKIQIPHAKIGFIGSRGCWLLVIIDGISLSVAVICNCGGNSHLCLWLTIVDYDCVGIGFNRNGRKDSGMHHGDQILQSLRLQREDTRSVRYVGQIVLSRNSLNSLVWLLVPLKGRIVCIGTVLVDVFLARPEMKFRIRIGF